MKNKTIKKILSLAMALNVSLSMSSLLFTYAEESKDDVVYTLVDETDENYIPYKEDVFTFDELLNMSDEDYIKLNTGYIPPEQPDGITTYQSYGSLAGCLQIAGYNVSQIISESVVSSFGMEKIEWPFYNGELYVFRGDIDSDEQRELNKMVNKSLDYPKDQEVFNNSHPVRAIFRRTDDNVFRPVSTIGISFGVSADKYMGIASFNKNAFYKKLVDNFGDKFNFSVVTSPTEDSFSIYFDLEDLEKLNNDEYDYTLENILYLSKIEKCISGICPASGDIGCASPHDVYKHDKNGNYVLYGDANDDGIIDVADLVAISSYVGNSEFNSLSEQGLLNADVHSEGNGITADDALVVQQNYLAKKIFG